MKIKRKLLQMKTRLFVFIFFMFCFTVQAQDNMLTVESYCDKALINNSGIKSAQFAQTAANAQAWQAFTNYFPKVSALGGVLSLNFFDGQVYADLNTINTSITFDLNEKLGGTLGGLKFSQILFAGGRIFNTNRLAKKGKEASGYELIMKQNEVRLSARQKYFQYLLIQELLETYEKYAETLDFLYKQVSEGVNRGVVSKTDFLKVQIKKEEIAIQQEETQQLFALSEKDLKLFAGIDESTKITVVDDFDALGEIVEPENSGTDFSSRLSMRPEYNLLNIQADAARLNELIAIGEYAPSVEAGLMMFRTDFYNGYWTKSKAYYEDTTAFVMFNFPISNLWEGFYKRQQMHALTLDARQDRDSKNKYLVLDMEQKFIALKTAYRHVRLAELNVQYADANLSSYKDGYTAGINTLGDYLGALGLSCENQTKLNQAKSDYWTAKTNFEQSTGG